VQHRLGTNEGIFASPEGARLLLGLLQLIYAGCVQPDERIGLFNTGSGLKYLEYIE
jgi:threonine synthase